MADPGHGDHVPLGEHEFRDDRGGAFGEQGHRVVAGQRPQMVGGRGRARCGGTRRVTSPPIASDSRLVAMMRSSGQYVSSVSARAATASTTCSQLSRISRIWRGSRNSARTVCSGSREGLQPECSRHHADHQRLVVQVGQFDQPRPVAEGALDARRDPQREAGLPTPPMPVTSPGGSRQHLLRLGQFVATIDETRQLRGQVPLPAPASYGPVGGNPRS